MPALSACISTAITLSNNPTAGEYKLMQPDKQTSLINKHVQDISSENAVWMINCYNKTGMERLFNFK